MKRIAIVGGGFSGLSIASNLLRISWKNNVKLAITIFEKLPPTQGGAYDVRLPNNFILNHEANFMGSLNPWSDFDNTTDFYDWVQEWKNKYIDILCGPTIKQKYTDIDLNNPNAFLPRSLYGLYLVNRLNDIQSWAKMNSIILLYKQETVKNIQNLSRGIAVNTDKSSNLFDFVVLCTGCEYQKKGIKNLLYAQTLYTNLNNIQFLETEKVGILGSSLSAIEIALALADKGYKNISLYSRSGRLPKVRGKFSPYTLRYITEKNLDLIKDKNGYFVFIKFLMLLKKEFTTAYKEKGEQAINWYRIYKNTDPSKKFINDLRASQTNQELIWRSVCLALAKKKSLIFPFINPIDEKIVFEKYSSLILSFLAPLPLQQAEKLENYIKNKTIRVYGGITEFKNTDNSWKLYRGKKTTTATILIDARGPEQVIEKNPLIKNLLASNVVEKSTVKGLCVNDKFQSVVFGKTLSRLYILGSVMKAYAPINNSTVYLQKPIQIVCEGILQNILRNKQIEEKFGGVFL